MKAAIVLLFISGLVTVLDNGVSATHKRRPVNEHVVNVKAPPPSFTLFRIPTLSSLTGSVFNLSRVPYFQGSPSRNQLEVSRTTKTEYLEVTRRQTVQPICYTAYEDMPPCLDFSYDPQEDDMEIQNDYAVNEVKRVLIKPTSAGRIIPTAMPEFVNENTGRESRHLRMRFPQGRKVTEESITGSEVKPLSFNFHRQEQPETSEIYTKTVLITKLEKYIDHRVTATLIATKCLPVGNVIAKCHSGHQPIKQSPDGFFDDRDKFSIALDEDLDIRSTATPGQE